MKKIKEKKKQVSELNSTVAENIKRLRKAKALAFGRKFTQTDLADESGISFRGIQDIEAGKSMPRGSTLDAIAKSLGVEISSITEKYKPSTNITQIQGKPGEIRSKISAVEDETEKKSLAGELLGIINLLDDDEIGTLLRLARDTIGRRNSPTNNRKDRLTPRR